MKNIDKIIKENINKCIKENLPPIGMRRLNEISINRMLNHGQEGMIIISACRSSIDCDWKPNISLEKKYRRDIFRRGLQDSQELRDKWLRDRNKTCDARLKKILRNSLFCYTEVYGGYHNPSEANSNGDTYELSYVVYNKSKKGANKGQTTNFEALKDLALWCGRIFAQDSVYVQEPGQAPNYIDPRTGNQENVSSSNNVTINRDKEEYFTTNKRKKNNPQKFHSDINFEVEGKFYKEYGSLIERQRAFQKYGEIYL